MFLDSIPKEMLGIKQWSVSYSSVELKRPLHHKYVPDGALSAEEADVKAGTTLLRGFYVTPDDPYILVDIDHVDNPEEPWDELPNNIQSFMLARSTYWEVSPSGKGLRGVLKLPSAEVKKELKSKRALLIDSEGNVSTEAEIHFGAPWMTITGNRTSYAVDEIATVTIDELQSVFNVKYVNENVLPDIIETSKKRYGLPSMADIHQALSAIPLDQNPRIRRAYKATFGQEYQHYDFWMKVMMAVHNYASIAGKNVECLNIISEWSQNDSEFKDDEDVLSHWKSLSGKDNQVTYKTLFKLRRESTLIWPVPQRQTKEQKEAGILSTPNIGAFENFEAVVKYYNLKFHRDELGTKTMYEVYVTGDSDIMDESFSSYSSNVEFGKYYGPFNRETITPCFNVFLQKLKFTGIGYQKTREFLSNVLYDSPGSINFVKEYINGQIELLPAKYQENIENQATSTLNDLFECLSIEFITTDHERELNLYRKYYMAWLLGLVRNLYHGTGKPNVNNCVLVLTGREQIRKTSHFKFLFPTFLRKYIAFTPHGFSNSDSMRDLAKIAVSRLVVVWDEVEQFLTPQTESNFKKIIDNNPQTFVDKYEIHEKTITPIAIYGATSNQREFKLGDQGSRRMFIIPVTWVDTDRMMSICWHTIFQELIGYHADAEAKGSHPWLLTESELEFQLSCHNKFKSKTDLDFIFEEIFDVEQPIEYTRDSILGISNVQSDKSGRLYTTKGVQDLLRQYDPSIQLKRPVLVHALERFCGKYSRTLRKRRTINRPEGSVYKGLITQSVHKRWVFPPFTKEAKKILYVFEKVD